MSETGPALLLAFDAADIGFVRFYNLASTAHRGHANDAHGLADTMRHEPRGFEGDTQGAGKLIARDALFARAEQIDRLQPNAHLYVAILEHGADFHGELLAALVALVGPIRVLLPSSWKAVPRRRNAGKPGHWPQPGFNPRVSGSLTLKDVCV